MASPPPRTRRLANLHRHLSQNPASAAAPGSQPHRLPAGDDARAGDTHTTGREDLDDDAPPTALELYQFDLNGYIIIKGAVSPAEVQRLNDDLDELPRPKMGEWLGRAHVTATGGSGHAHGAQIQQCYELGGPFEELVDHPSYFGKVRCFLGPEAGGKGDSGWDNHPYGLPTIDEAFVNFRSEGGAISMHGPQNSESVKMMNLYSNEKFHIKNEGLCIKNDDFCRLRRSTASESTVRVDAVCFVCTCRRLIDLSLIAGTFFSGEINMALALSDIGPGDGATMVIPGGHKSNVDYRTVLERPDGPGAMSGVLGAVELHMEAGDVLLFVDCLTHGAAVRTNLGVRRTVWHRYTMAWSRLRWGYTPSVCPAPPHSPGIIRMTH